MVEVSINDELAYIDNQDGWALSVFLKGIAPLPKFRFVPIFAVRDDETSEPFYKAKMDFPAGQIR